MATNIVTATFFDQIRITPMWPPGHATNRVMTALLPYSAIPDGIEWMDELDLAADDWFKHAGYGPCLVLGECSYGSAGNYYPKPSYPLSDVIYQTKLHRGPQREQEAKIQKRIEQEKGVAAASAERAKHWAASVDEQRRDLERKEKELKELSPRNQYKRLLQLEEETKDLRALLTEVKKIAELSLAESKKINERLELTV